MNRLVIGMVMMFLGAQVWACTQIIGFSQTSEWFKRGHAQRYLPGGDPGWELLKRGGAGVEKWADPDYGGWRNPIYSGCGEPTRILLTISSNTLGTDRQGYIEAIEQALITIQDKRPRAEEIILQSVVGRSRICLYKGEAVRATVQWSTINKAINRVMKRKNWPGGITITRGMRPEVSSCTHFRDSKGHLNHPGARSIARKIGRFYSDRL